MCERNKNVESTVTKEGRLDDLRRAFSAYLDTLTLPKKIRKSIMKIIMSDPGVSGFAKLQKIVKSSRSGTLVLESFIFFLLMEGDPLSLRPKFRTTHSLFLHNPILEKLLHSQQVEGGYMGFTLNKLG